MTSPEQRRYQTGLELQRLRAEREQLIVANEALRAELDRLNGARGQIDQLTAQRDTLRAFVQQAVADAPAAGGGA